MLLCNYQNFAVILLCIIGRQHVNAAPALKWDDIDESQLDDFNINLAKDFPRIYGTPDPKVGEKLKKAANESSDATCLDQLGTYMEGDMLLVKEQRTVLVYASHWHNATIPFEFAANVDVDMQERIINAFSTFERHTCLRFVPHTNEPDYVHITGNQEGCYSSLGKTPGRSLVNLQRECTIHLGNILHEFMHTLGFVHEQNRWDRDKYVQILLENVQPEKLSDFKLYTAEELNGYNIEYDYRSVMHYPWDAFSRNGQPTVKSKSRIFKTKYLGQRAYFSPLDIKKINLVYNCPKNDDIVNQIARLPIPNAHATA